MLIPPHITPTLLGVSASTLADWRRDRRTPGPVAARLLALHTQRRIMPDLPAWHDWQFQGGFLETWTGDHVSPAELDSVRLLRCLLDNAHRDAKALKTRLAAADAYIAELEGKRAPANAARWSG